ncbi:restriction endonuclease subunit S [Microcoleus vaginatus]|uniref:restriction endonuclease subunit S n=1 Tax=Microcoleus vaginatus TaxID=119532 RepID=UPI0016899CA6|nr:restriction endonuclease subunit S [Microcoleus sp. FACHB-84]MBD2010596.1 restriction endonuclease subunit S [Microcoleus sp. FACHB-45]
MSRKQGKLEPQLRFSNFTNHWSKQNLGELCDKIQDGNYGESYPKSDEFLDTGIPFLTSKAISKTGEIIKSKVDHISPEKHTQLAKAHLKINDVLFTNRGANVGVIGFVDNTISNGNIGPQLTLLRANGKVILPLFLKYYMNTYAFQKQVHSQDSGSAMNFFGIGETKKFIIYVPLIAEQEKIGSFLGTIDTRLTQLRRKHELLQTYKRGVMQKLFSQQIRFKGDDGKPFPDWQKKKLGEIASRQVKKNLDESITRVLTNSAVQGVIDQQDYFDKDIANADNLAGYYIIEKGDYVYNPRISTSAPVGPIHKNKIGLGVMSPLYTVFRFKTKEDAFYEQLFKTSVWHKYMCSVANYGARYDRMNITTSDFMALPLPYPISEEQEKIVDFLTAMDQKIEAIAQQIQLTEQYKKGLLQKMFV